MSLKSLTFIDGGTRIEGTSDDMRLKYEINITQLESPRILPKRDRRQFRRGDGWQIGGILNPRVNYSNK